MTILQGQDGKSYDFPEDAVDAAVSTGQFIQPSAPKDIPEPPQFKPGSQEIEVPKLVEKPVEKPAENPNTILLKDQQGNDVAVPEDQADAKIIAGTHTVSNIPLVGTDGKLYDIPDDKIAEALKSGEFKLSTLAERNQNRANIEIERGGLTGLKPYVGGAIDALAGAAGIHNPVFGGVLEPMMSAAEKARLEKNKEDVSEEYPTAYYSGATAGELTSAGGLGVLGEGAANKFAPTIASKLPISEKAARIGIEGAVYSSEPVVKHLIEKDPAGAAESLAFGVGLNFGINKAFSYLGTGAGKIAKTIEENLTPGKSFAQTEAENLIGKQVLGLSPGKIAELRDKIGPMLKAAKVTQEDIVNGTAMEKIQKLAESGPEIGKIIDQLDQFPDKAGSIADSLDNAQEKIKSIMPSEAAEKYDAIKHLESQIKKLEQLKFEKDPIKAAEELTTQRQIVSDQRGLLKQLGKLSPSAEQALKTLGPYIDETKSVAEKGTFQDLQKLVKWGRDQTNFGDITYVNQLRKQAGSVLKQAKIDAENDVITKMDELDPTKEHFKIATALEEQRALYSFEKMFGDAADRLNAKQVPSDVLSKLVHTGLYRHGLLPLMLHMIGVPSPIAIGAGLATPLIKKYLAKQDLGRAAEALSLKAEPTVQKVTMGSIQKLNKLVVDNVKDLYNTLKAGAVSSATKQFFEPKKNILAEFVPDDTAKKDQLAVLQRNITANSVHPENLIGHLATVTAPLTEEGLGSVAKAYTDHQIRLMKVLQAVIPKDTTMSQAYPFSAKVEGDEISPETKEKYERVLTIAADPTSLLHMIKDNSITAGDVAIAAAINPSTLQKMRQALIDEALKSKPNTTYQQRLSIGILMGQNIDESTNQLPILQQSFAVGTVPPVPGPGKTGSKMSAKSQNNIIDSYKTVSQHGI